MSGTGSFLGMRTVIEKIKGDLMIPVGIATTPTPRYAIQLTKKDIITQIGY